MDGLYFLAMLAGIGWLCWWASRPPGPARPSPFDMRMAEPTDAHEQRKTTKTNPSGYVQHAVPAQLAAQSWDRRNIHWA